MTVYELIRSLVDAHVGVDADEIAPLVFDKIDCPDEWRQWFYPLVHNECRRDIRRRVRTRAGRSGDSVVVQLPIKSKRDRSAAITRPQFLLDTIETFGEWGRVPFGDMTVEMHESRIAGQLKLAAGVKRDIDRHTEAINRITAGGVECLNDLPEYGGKAAS